MELLDLITKQLGVSQEQAKGGSGLLLKLAKEKLGAGDFGKISEVIPGTDDMISAAPAQGVMAGAMSGFASKLGGPAGQLGNIASLAGGFKELGLDSGMVAKFLPLVLSFAESKGGSGIKAMLEKALK